MARSPVGGTASNTNPTGVPQGTLGGIRMKGRRPGSINMMPGEEVYLWILVGLEVGFLAMMRKKMRRHHGG
jgi:hypothetical protein